MRSVKSSPGRRLRRYAIQGLILVGLAASTIGYATLHKELTIDVNGNRTEVTAYGRTVGEVLANQHVELTPTARVTPAVDTHARGGSTIKVRTVHDVTVEVDGERETIPTTAHTVGELLTALGTGSEGAVADAPRSQLLGKQVIRVSTVKTVQVAVDGAVIPITTTQATVGGVLEQAGIELAGADSVSVPKSAAAVNNMLVLVNRSTTSADTVTQSIAFKTTQEKDPTLPKGQQVIVTNGVVGQSVTTYAVTSVGDSVVSRKVVSQKVVRQPVTEVVKVGTMDTTTAEVSPGSARAIGKSLAAARGWGDDQFACLDKLWNKESKWNVSAYNAGSGAYGIPQALPGSKMASAGSDWRTNAATQITWGLGYIEGRYGTPCGAWSHSVSSGWY